jgi:peptidyl-prolyl cis-trans isomerase C
MALTVNGVVIPEERIAQEIGGLREGYESYIRGNGGEPTEKELREWAEENLIEAELLRAEAVATQPQPTDEAVRRNIEEFPEFFQAIPEAERMVRSREALCVRSMEKALRKSLPRLSDAELKAYYNKNAAVIKSEETLRLMHIVRLIGVNGGDRATAYLGLLHAKSELAKGTLSWTDAVAAYSDTGSEDFGVFPEVSRGQMTRAVEDALFALKPGEVSDVVELDSRSAHLFKLFEKVPPRVLSFKEVRESLARVLFDQSYQDALNAKCDALKASAVIRRES